MPGKGIGSFRAKMGLGSVLKVTLETCTISEILAIFKQLCGLVVEFQPAAL